MKTKHLSLFILGWMLCIAAIAYGDNPMLYVAEPQMDSDDIKTSLTVYHLDGTISKELSVNGIMAKMSPDGNAVASIIRNEKQEGAWTLCVSDSSGMTTPIMHFYVESMHFPNYSWSPKGDKLSVLRWEFKRSGNRKKIGYEVKVLVFDFVKSTVTQPYKELRNVKEEELYALRIQWFPDNHRLLLSKWNETLIVDSDQNTVQPIFKDSLQSFVTDDGKTIISLSSPEKWMFDIWQYDMNTQKNEKQHSLKFYPSGNDRWNPLVYVLQSALSHDGKYLIFRNPNPKPDYILTDIPAKQNIPVDTQGIICSFNPFRLIPINTFRQFNLKAGGRMEGTAYST